MTYGLSVAPLGVCGERGYRDDIEWTAPAKARRLAKTLDSTNLADVTPNPHMYFQWAKDIVSSPAILKIVTGMIGPNIAVENTFLMAKHREKDFFVPPHQDGTNPKRLFNPYRSVTIWAAITNATVHNGCLWVVPGSHSGGYIPHAYAAPEPGRGAPYAAVITDLPNEAWTSVELTAGRACAMDMRLLHCSQSNHSNAIRVGLNIRYTAPGGFTVLGGTPPTIHVVSGSGF